MVDMNKSALIAVAITLAIFISFYALMHALYGWPSGSGRIVRPPVSERQSR